MSKRKTLFVHPGILRARYLKDDFGGGATGGSPAGGGNNGGDNSGDSGSPGGDSNNAGDGFDPAAFWQGPGSDNGSAPNGESAGDGTQNSGTGGSDADLSATLTQQLGQLSFGDPVFDASVAEQINNGDFNGVQERFNAMGQNIVRQSLSMMVQILRPFSETIMNQVRGEVEGTFSSRDDSSALAREFPAARDPRVAPLIQQVYDQALKNTGRDRAAAVAQTKEMLRFMAGNTAGDLGLNVAPRGADDFGRAPNQSINWLDELSGR